MGVTRYRNNTDKLHNKSTNRKTLYKYIDIDIHRQSWTVMTKTMDMLGDTHPMKSGLEFQIHEPKAGAIQAFEQTIGSGQCNQL